MKNTMKIKSLLSFFVPAAILSLSVASCSDYDNGYTESAIKFQEEFKKAYGDIDPEQDWNLAERGTVTVSTSKESEVKIYALRGNEYCLVGDYEGVIDTRVLGFDMIEGTTSIMVTDGETAQKTVPGDVVTFGGTRTVIEDPYDSNGDGIKVTKLTGDTEINGDSFSQYRASTKAEVDNMFACVPQGKNNLDKVAHDFSYVSTGSFVIYPYYWYTTSENTLGIYFTDAAGYHEVDIYESKGEKYGTNNTGELWYAMENVVQDDMTGWRHTHDSNSGTYRSFAKKDPASDGSISADQNDPSGILAPFMEFYRTPSEGIHHVKLVKEFTVSANAECLVEVAARLRNQKDASYNDIGRVTFTANNETVELTADGNCTRGTYSYNGNTQGNLYSNMNGTGKIWVKCKADSNGKITVEWDINTNNASHPANWFSFKNLTITQLDMDVNDMTITGSSEFPGINTDPNKVPGDTSDDIYAKLYKGQGIRVDIPAGTKFGMYIKKKDGDIDYTIYSEGAKNESKTGLVGADHQFSPCYASTFYAGDQMFIGFEDWPATTGGDYDLNDLVLAFDGAKPIIINEDPQSFSWLLVCEDLGGSFDTDYNDVIFKVDHVSGQNTAHLTAMAAGGTLASYIFFRDPTTQNAEDQCLGEIHQLFNVAPEKSGAYSPINAYSRYDKAGNTVTFNVGENWTLAWYSTDTWQSEGTQYATGVNMGGFQIRTLRSGIDAPNSATAKPSDDVFNNSSTASVIAAPGKGDAPYILCLPYKYTKVVGNKLNTYVWAWPQELATICSAAYDNGKYKGSSGGAYLKFGGWVENHSDNDYREWYNDRNPNGLTVEELLLSSQSLSEDMLQDPQLHPVNNPMVVNRGAIPNFVGNLESLSNGEYTIQVAGMSNTYNGESLWNAGDRQITVTQAAAGIYTGATTSFTLRILKDDSDLSVAANATMIKGNPFNLMSLITSTSSTGNITFKVRYGSQNWVVNCGEPYNADRPGQTVAYNASECGFTPTSTDNLTVEIYQAADNNFHESSVKTCAVTVSESGGGENTLSYTKQAMTLEADGNDYYTLGSSGHNYIISGSAFSSYSDAITINITGFTGNNLKAFIGSDDLTGFISKNQGDTWSISLTATQVNAVKSSNFTIKSSGDPTLVVKVQ